MFAYANGCTEDLDSAERSPRSYHTTSRWLTASILRSVDRARSWHRPVKARNKSDRSLKFTCRAKKPTEIPAPVGGSGLRFARPASHDAALVSSRCLIGSPGSESYFFPIWAERLIHDAARPRECLQHA